ncbi:helix-turn-helix transcriptional regulator [Nocardia sp. NPDC004604]|uniref:helix-turn-helix transcriptional regulator n=1 Tax=Nocardia sp. NPDC004604 TaxID=3157013 RepID=UPI0033B95EAA
MSDDDRCWAGTALLRPGMLAVTGELGTSGLHAHHSVHVILSSADIVLEDATGDRLACRAAVIPPDVPHAIVQGAAAGYLCHLDSESTMGVRLARLVDPADSVVGWSRAATELSTAAGWFRGILDPGLPPEDSVRHPAITRVLALLPDRLDGGSVRTAELARAVGLSESRLLHLFTAEVGLPFRSYVRWLRMQCAVELVATGCTLTEAAHGAGFADSSHLNRVCRSVFGGAPSEFARLHWITEFPG